MFGGLAAGYGTFAVMAGRYFFPVGDNKEWFFVSDAEGIQPGESVAFKSPAGVQVSITRRADVNEKSISAESFLALSSICPHLGCRVHWEPHNDRYFCPCHNGVFDKQGTAVSGPPAAAKQNLPRYPLMVSDGKLYIQMSSSSV
jgi:Rieske Fe-S protein